MKPFNDYLNAAGETLPYPVATYLWVAYKAGKVSVHTTKHEATDVSPNVERIETEESISYRKDVNEHNRKIEQAAYNAWWSDFKLEYQDMPKKLFDVLFDEAYDRAHSSGYDSVANKFSDLAYFAERIIDATK